MGTVFLILGDKINYADDMYSCLKNADVLAILTEWSEFRLIDLSWVNILMRYKNIVDCCKNRNKTRISQCCF